MEQFDYDYELMRCAALDDAIDHLNEAIDYLAGSATDTANAHLGALTEIRDAAMDESHAIEKLLDEADRRDLEALNREYERGLL